MSYRVLGLDASTSTIGISILEVDDNNDIKVLFHDYYKPDKSVGIVNMVIAARTHIVSLARQYVIDEFVIEDYVKFMKGRSSASTVIPLAILNMTLRIACLDFLGKDPVALSVMKIRHTLKFGKGKIPPKESIPGLVSQHLGWVEYPWLKKINRRTKEEVIMEESYDVADAIAVALAFVKIKSSPPKAKRSKAKSK
jgi:Holliday junction resolvasome RuvABC endonuclease subunit